VPAPVPLVEPPSCKVPQTALLILTVRVAAPSTITVSEELGKPPVPEPPVIALQYSLVPTVMVAALAVEAPSSVTMRVRSERAVNLFIKRSGCERKAESREQKAEMGRGRESVKGRRRVATGLGMETTAESTAPASAGPCPEPLRTMRPVVFTPGALNDCHDNTTRNPPSSGFYAITDSRIPARTLDRHTWLKPLLSANNRG